MYVGSSHFGNLEPHNNVIFNGKVVDLIKLFIVVQIKAWAWVNHKFPNTNFSYSD